MVLLTQNFLVFRVESAGEEGAKRLSKTCGRRSHGTRSFARARRAASRGSRRVGRGRCVSKLPVISGADCVKALGKIGFEVYRQRGSHIVIVRTSPPSQTTIPNHKELDRGTLRAIIRQTGLTVEEFITLL